MGLLCVCVCVFVCVCVCMYACMYIYMYIHICMFYRHTYICVSGKVGMAHLPLLYIPIHPNISNSQPIYPNQGPLRCPRDVTDCLLKKEHRALWSGEAALDFLPQVRGR